MRFSVVEVDWVVSSGVVSASVVVGCLVAGPSVVVVAGSGVFLPGVVWSEVGVSSWVVVSVVSVVVTGPEVVVSCWVVVNSDSDVVVHVVSSLVVSAVGEVSAVVVGSSVVVEVSVVATN